MSLKMKSAVLDELIRRLRSGDYHQGQSALRLRNGEGMADTYCCLGVMCEIAVEEGVITREPARNVGGGYWYGNSNQGSDIYLPDDVVIWAGIVSDIEKESSMDEYFYEQRGAYGEAKHMALAVMNDDGKPFPEIADWLAANVERV